MHNNKDQGLVSSLLMFTIFVLLILAMTACSTTVPVTAKFPEPPKYNTSCPQLQKLSDGAKLSDVATTVTVNYSTYYECAVKTDAWIEWYEIQKSIFEGAK